MLFDNLTYFAEWRVLAFGSSNISYNDQEYAVATETIC